MTSASVSSPLPLRSDPPLRATRTNRRDRKDELRAAFLRRLKAGDCLAVHRRSRLQWHFDRTGDYATHVLIVDRAIDGALSTIEIGPLGVWSRSVDDVLDAYSDVLHLSNAMSSPCIDEMMSLARAARRANAYSFSKVAATGLQLHQYARRYAALRVVDRLVVRSGTRSSALLSRALPRQFMTCSGFVYRCLLEGCDSCRPSDPWPARARPTATSPMPGFSSIRSASVPGASFEPDVVSTMVTPSDLCIADCFGRRTAFRPASGRPPTVLHPRAPRPGTCLRDPERDLDVRRSA